MSLVGSSAVASHPRERVTDTDIASELLTAELVLNDIAAVQATQKGKAREGAPRSDEDIAFDLQAASSLALIGALHDRQFASSIDRAIGSDLCQLGRIALVERAERDDHQAAVALGEGRHLPRQTTSQRRMAQTAQYARESSPAHSGQTTNTAKVDTEVIGVCTQDTDPVDSESEPGQSSGSLNINIECLICGDRVSASRSLKAPCEHYYCEDCIDHLVRTSLRDEGSYPLRCCDQPLPLESGVFRFISLPLRLLFLIRQREYSVPAGSRVYCSNARCSRFLGASEDTRKDLTCSSCRTVSCSRCRNKAHPGEVCFEHQLLRKLRETATANKWQTCPKCRAIVELSQGCYHITCRCSTQFCYLCAAQWKTCKCQRWDEEHLLDGAERRRVRNVHGD